MTLYCQLYQSDLSSGMIISNASLISRVGIIGYQTKYDFGSCQLNTSICKLGATAITFDNIPSPAATETQLPTNYTGLSWTNGRYINTTAFPTSGYRFACSSGEYVAWSNSPITIQTLVASKTITFHSCITAAGWSDSLSVLITGYYSSTQLYTATYPLNTYTRTSVVLNWSGLNKIAFT